MGYDTWFSGTIRLQSLKAKEIIKDMLDKNEGVFVDCSGTTLNESRLDIGENWRNYENAIEKLCLFVATLDKKAEGEVWCDGEESEDRWKIIIKEGKVKSKQGRIVYAQGIAFNDLETKKLVYEKTKDKKLFKEIMVESI